MRNKDGTIESTADGYVLRFVRQLAHPVHTVWAALTDPDARSEWFFLGRLDLVAGGVVELTDSANGIRGRTLAVDPPWLLEFTWDSLDAPGEALVRFELMSTPQGCTLTFTHTVSASANPDRLAAGWHMLLDALPRHLDGLATTSGAVHDADSGWATHYSRYRERVNKSG
jgi:uncharacterized protein YndB with AHSA1/START domain